MEKLELDGGKYTVLIKENGVPVECLRHGESWRDILGDNLIYWLICEIKDLREQLEKVNKLHNTYDDSPDLSVEEYELINQKYIEEGIV